MKITELVHLRIGPSKGNNWANGKNFKNPAFGSVGKTEVKSQLLEVIGLLQDEFADFGLLPAVTSGQRQPEFLLPQPGTLDDVERLRVAGELFVPLLDSDRGNHRITSRLGQIEIG